MRCMPWVLVGLWLGAGPAMAKKPGSKARKAAKELNAHGMHDYDGGEYEGASDKFRAAIKADPTWAIPPYNLACTLAIRLKTDVCVDTGEIMDLLERSVKLDKRRLKRIKNDRDLETVRDLFRYYVLMGADPKKPFDREIMIGNIIWWGPLSVGMHGNGSGLSFEGSTFKYWSLDVSPEGVAKKEHESGKYRFDKGDVVLQMKGGEMRGKLSADGKLTFKKLGVFTDQRECGL